MANNQYTKDPSAILDWAYDWTGWLAAGETITDHTITADTGITADSSTESDGKIAVWLSGGTADMIYRVECKITTNMGRTDERSIWITVRER